MYSDTKFEFQSNEINKNNLAGGLGIFSNLATDRCGFTPIDIGRFIQIHFFGNTDISK